MTHRERIEAALNHREPDRTPCFEYVLLPPVAEHILGRRTADYAGDAGPWFEFAAEVGWESAVRQYAIDRLDAAEILDHDMLYVAPNPPPPSPAPANPRNEPLATDDPVEAILRRLANQPEKPSGIPEHSLLIYHFLHEEMKRRGLDLPILVPAYAHGVWTDVELLQTIALEPEVARRHFEAATTRSLAAIESFIALGVSQIGVGGDFAGMRPLISPEAYRTFIMPEVKKLSRRIHEAGLYAINASDGNLWSLIDDFLIGTEVDGYLEIDMHAGMDMKRLKHAYGDRVTLFGNMDCGNVMSFASLDEVARVTRDILRAGLGSGGHIFCCSNAITASVPLTNYMAMVNAYREFFA